LSKEIDNIIYCDKCNSQKIKFKSIDSSLILCENCLNNIAPSYNKLGYNVFTDNGNLKMFGGYFQKLPRPKLLWLGIVLKKEFKPPKQNKPPKFNCLPEFLITGKLQSNKVKNKVKRKLRKQRKKQLTNPYNSPSYRYRVNEFRVKPWK